LKYPINRSIPNSLKIYIGTGLSNLIGINVGDLQKICNDLKGTTEDIKWEDHLCFNVGNKIYLITSPDSLPQAASFKTKEEDFNILCERKGFMPVKICIFVMRFFKGFYIFKAYTYKTYIILLSFDRSTFLFILIFNKI